MPPKLLALIFLEILALSRQEIKRGGHTSENDATGGISYWIDIAGELANDVAGEIAAEISRVCLQCEEKSKLWRECWLRGKK